MFGQGATPAQPSSAPSRAAGALQNLERPPQWKELIAHALHHCSRRKGNFVAVDCGALHRETAESLLFGHFKGSFTTAVSKQVGRIESAHLGTLFLDEIHNLPLDLQVKFQRVLESKVVQPLGSALPRQVDVRVVALREALAGEQLERPESRGGCESSANYL